MNGFPAVDLDATLKAYACAMPASVGPEHCEPPENGCSVKLLAHLPPRNEVLTGISNACCQDAAQQLSRHPQLSGVTAVHGLLGSWRRQ